MATVQNTQREQELANIIWDIKEIIRNLYDDAEVEDVILPFTLLRRLDCVLDDKRDAIMQELKDTPEAMRKFKLKALMKKNNLSFFNTSGLSLERLLGAPEQIGQSFETYLNGFTDNVKDILANFVHSDTDSEIVDLTPIYSRLERGDKLFSVIQLFVQRADLHPDVVTNAMMGTVFEIVIRRSKEASNTKAGQFYTPREIVRLLVSLTLCGQESKLYEYGKHFTVYDPCCGTGGMLTVCKEYLEELSGRPDPLLPCGHSITPTPKPIMAHGDMPALTSTPPTLTATTSCPIICSTPATSTRRRSCSAPRTIPNWKRT